jgi:uncharacterized membrane protein
MDWAHIHLALNHFPIILSIMGALAAILATLVPRRGTWMYAATSLTLAGLFVIPTYFTGEPAEEVLARPWYITRGTIQDHEGAALISAGLVGVVALIAALTWRRMVRYPRETSLPGALRNAMLVGSMIASAHIFYTSLLGGRIVHDSDVLRGPRPAGIPAPPSRPDTATRQTPASLPSTPSVTPQTAPVTPPPPATTTP